MIEGFEGRVENFDGLELIGWLYFEEPEPPELVVEIDGWGKRIAKGLYLRADIAASKGDSSRGFRIYLDDLYPDMKKLIASSPDGDFRLTLSAQHPDETATTFFEFIGQISLLNAAASTRSPVDGRVDTFDEKWISGWAIADGSESTEIEILADDKVISTTLTGQYRGDLASRGPYGKYGGFIMATPASLCDGFPHVVSVRQKSGWVFPGFPRKTRLGKVIGVVEKIERNSVEGWFGVLRNSDLTPEMLSIACNGEPIGMTNLRNARQDVVVAGLAAYAHAFRFETKRGIFAEDVVAVTDPESSYQLRIAENARAANLPSAIAGHLDQINDSEIVGWAVDRRSLSSSLRVIAFVDGIPVGEGTTEGFRVDVQRMFPQSLRSGFTIRTPTVVRDGKPHQVELRVAGASRALSGTPATANLSKPPVVFREVEAADLGKLDLQTKIHSRKGRKVNRQAASQGVSHIILNRNGGEVFVRCLESLLRYIDFQRDELIVVDHASDDISRDALRSLEKAELVKVIWKTRNDSFSKSNNDAAAQASKPILLLLNNDIEFICDISRGIENHLASLDIGAVGIKLYDIVELSADAAAERNLRELRIQHLGVWFHPGQVNSEYNLTGYDITSASSHREMFGVHEVAVVTGAALGIRAEDFKAIGGFDEEYFYGTEDIDLCVRVRRLGKRIVCDRNLAALHVRGYTRFTHRGGGASDRFAKNNKHLWSKFGASMRRAYLQSLVARDGIYGPARLRIGLAVTDSNPSTLAGDYFTALELATALVKNHGVEYVFLSEKEDWYDCRGIDVVIVMRHDYDIRRCRNRPGHCLFFGWARNHFESWLKQPWLGAFDAMLSSSKLFSFILYRSHGIRAHTLYIATSFTARPASDIPIEYDALFVGSRWGAPREIESALVPERIDGSVGVFGAGFDEVEALRSVWGGILHYSDVEAQYHRSNIVIDDANATTKRWGSPNSRVFDAIAAGAFVISNSAKTSEVLENTIPVWRDADELTKQINSLLSNKKLLQREAAKQAKVVRDHHTYSARAERFLEILKAHVGSSLRIDILTAVPSNSDADLWGDWHFARSLAISLRKEGHAVCVRKLGEKVDRAIDATIGLRGLQRFTPTTGAINILWIISHPDLVAPDELAAWDHIFTASQPLVDRFQGVAKSISLLEQATEFGPSSLRINKITRKGAGTEFTGRGVFVGNTRGVSRAFIEMASRADVDFDIWGDGWKGTTLEERLVGTNIENKALGSLYAASSFVLSDHWSDMARQGIVSNRIFDALAAGGVVITDPVAGLEKLRLPNLFVCRTEAEISDASRKARSISHKARLEGAKFVAERYSFDRRATTIVKRITTLLA
jgi:GT2 family glycosyltransferase/spore maturation protein CgeB